MAEPTFTDKRPWLDAVTRARAGDPEAFTEVVKEFSGLAGAMAQAWLGDPAAAQDVVQEAFLDAHGHLAELREPGAFVAWFRRIVVKHCDRVTRRRAPEALSFEDVAPLVDPEPGPEAALDDAQHLRRARLAIEALPAAERLVFALANLAGCSGAEIAGFLDLPLSTVKKRLRTARALLRDQGATATTAAHAQFDRPDLARLGDEVAFFIALRAGDRARVKALLARRPELVEARQDWSAELTFDRILPFPNRATALITAIERDELDLVRLLLDAGADPNGRCGCATEEPPLWTAAVFGRVGAARLLLDRGADPDATAASGTTALHVAAMRGFSELAEVLLAAGANPDLPDRGGPSNLPWRPVGAATIPPASAADWARRGGHVVLAALLNRARSDDRASTADPPRAAGRRAERVSTPVVVTPNLVFSGVATPSVTTASVARSGVLPAGTMILETGIRALDLFAPLPRGGLVYVPFRAGVGMLVLLGELCARIARNAGGAAVWTGFAQRPFDVGDLDADIAEFGLTDVIEPYIASLDASPEARRAAFTNGLARVRELCRAGRDVLVVVTNEPGFASDVDAALPELASMPGPGSATALVIGAFQGAAAPDSFLRAPWGARIVLDRARARNHLFPAIDPAASASTLLRDGAVTPRHARLSEAARACLAELALRDPEFATLTRLATPGDEPGHQLLRMLCQPFITTSPFTGLPGEHTTLDELLDRTEALLRGAAEVEPPAGATLDTRLDH